MADTQPSPSKLVRLLRERLGRTDARDIASDYGDQTEGKFNLYDQIVGQVGLDEAISALVAYAVKHDNLPKLVEVIVDWRKDLAAPIAALSKVTAQQAKEQLQPANTNINTGGGANINGNVTNSGGVNIYGGQVGNIFIVQEKDVPPNP